MMIVISHTTERDGDEFIPVITVNGENRYFTSPKGEPNHNPFTEDAEAFAYAKRTVDVLHNTVMHFLQAEGFIVVEEPGQ
jgi:hypothetical protein